MPSSTTKWLGAVTLGIACGVHPLGLAADTAPDPAVIERLQALGYLAGIEAPPEVSGVRVHDRERAFRGSNFYVAGDAPEARLVDMDGTLLHRWRATYESLADAELRRRDLADKPSPFYRRGHLFPNGDVLVIFNNLVLAKLDRDSNVLWRAYDLPHHDLDVTPEGEIWVIGRRLHVFPELAKRSLRDDLVLRLDAQGRELDRLSIVRALQNGGQHELLEQIRANAWTRKGLLGDVLHTNSIEVLDGRLANRVPAFRAGNLLLSTPHLHAIFVVDMQERAVTWVLRGAFRHQHHPTVLDNGHLLLFDNRRGDDRRSWVQEIDPATGTVEWEWGGTDTDPMYSWCCGTCYRLPNGNTLVVETQGGRAIEITRDGTVVWELVVPHRVGPEQETIAQLFDLVRLPPDFPLDWLSADGPG